MTGLRFGCIQFLFVNLTSRMDNLRQVLQDMLQLLQESASSRHNERLEQIVIALIAVEIGAYLSLHTNRLSAHFAIVVMLVIGITTILVDLFA